MNIFKIFNTINNTITIYINNKQQSNLLNNITNNIQQTTMTNTQSLTSNT